MMEVDNKKELTDNKKREREGEEEKEDEEWKALVV